MVFWLGNDIIISGWLYIQHVHGRNKTHNSRLVMDILEEAVPVTSKINNKFVFTLI